jgi:Ca-activated chloride channel family protein
MMMIGETLALVVGLLSGIGEYWHARRCRRTARLAFGPGGAPRRWTKAAPFLRVAALMMLAWGLHELWTLVPRARQIVVSATAEQHLVLALDVSPSMQLKDAGPQRQQARAQRASDVVLSILERADLSRLRMSVVAFYTGAKPVVVDTYDLAVVKNILDDLPLELAFDTGQTSLLDGVREAATVARDWTPGSTTLLVVSDGDTIPDTGLSRMPPSIRDALVLGVGSNGAGINIDGHLSRQDSSTLRQLAARLGGNYFDANERHVPTKELRAFARSLPERQDRRASRREWALAAVAVGSSLLALLPVALAVAGSVWPYRARTAVRRQTPSTFSSVASIAP